MLLSGNLVVTVINTARIQGAAVAVILAAEGSKQRCEQMMKLTTVLVVLSGLVGCSTPRELPQVADAVTPAEGIVAAGRLKPDDIERLQHAGIRYVIDLTPDAETPDFDEAEAIRSAGLGYSNLPLRGAIDLTRENAIAFDRMMRDAKRPVLVHCASGNRVGAMAALRAAWIEGKSEEEAVAIGKAWGLKGLESQVRERIRNRQ
jgi:uncharacterized protein (TIGR01244 family)